MLELRSRTPLATGHLRLVFADPNDSSRLVKVMRPEAVEQRWGGAARWHKRLPRARHYSGFVRELHEYVALHARGPVRDAPIARALGLVETDYGLGFVVEKLCGTDGELAPTLEALVRRDGRADWIVRGLEDWIASVIAHNVIVGDVNLGNFVHGVDRGNRERFVMIDGFGEKNVFPYCSMSRALNRWNSRRLYARLLRKLDRALAERSS